MGDGGGGLLHHVCLSFVSCIFSETEREQRGRDGVVDERRPVTVRCGRRGRGSRCRRRRRSSSRLHAASPPPPETAKQGQNFPAEEAGHGQQHRGPLSLLSLSFISLFQLTQFNQIGMGSSRFQLNGMDCFAGVAY